MKRHYIQIFISLCIVFLLLSITMVACSTKKIYLDSEEKIVALNDIFELNAKAENMNIKNAYWSCSKDILNLKVIDYNKVKVKAIQEGEGIVTVQIGTIKKECKVKIKQSSLNNKHILMSKGESRIIDLETAITNNCNWVSKNGNLVNITHFNDKLAINALNEGETELYLKNSDGDILANVSLLVVNEKKPLLLNKNLIKLDINNDEIIKLKAYCEKEKKINWEIEDSSFAKIIEIYNDTKNVIIKPLKSGNTKIIAKCGDEIEYCNLEFTDYNINFEKENLKINNGESKSLKIIHNFNKGDVQFKIIGDKIINLIYDINNNENEIVIKGLKRGKCQIIAYNKTVPTIFCECNVFVSDEILLSINDMTIQCAEEKLLNIYGNFKNLILKYDKNFIFAKFLNDNQISIIGIRAGETVLEVYSEESPQLNAKCKINIKENLYLNDKIGEKLDNILKDDNYIIPEYYNKNTIII